MQEQVFASSQKSLLTITKQLDGLLLKYTSPSNADGSIISDEEFQMLKGRLVKQRAALEQDLNVQGKNIEDWVDLSERTFNFARYARKWFEKGDMEVRRAIFACLGSHLLLKDQKVSLILKKPFKFIFEGFPQAEQELERLEPLATAINPIDFKTLAQKFDTWSG